MDAATLAGFDPVWPVLAAAAAMLIAIVIGIVRYDRLASRQPAPADSPAAPTESGRTLSAAAPAETSTGTGSAPPPR